MKILLLLLFFSTQAFSFEESPKEAYARAQKADHARIKIFIDDLRSDKICKGADFNCLASELKGFGTKSASAAHELLLGAFMYYFKVKTKLESTGCDKHCLMPYTTKLVDSSIDYLKSVDYQKFFLYSELKNEILESRFLRYIEDVNYYNFLLKMIPKIRAYSLQVEIEKLSEQEATLKSKVGKFSAELSELELGKTLRGSDIALLDTRSEMYQFYLQTLKDPVAKEDFIKYHARLQGNLTRK